MAREEQDREDILTEAVALVERAEIELLQAGRRVLAGFRRDGCGSVYFDADPVYHFNSRHELRRAFYGGRLFKAECGRLVALARERTPGEVRLVRHELNDSETADFLRDLARRWQQLTLILAAGDFQFIGQVPESTDVIRRWRSWLPQVDMPARIAASPQAS